jgi:hypothetical protein
MPPPITTTRVWDFILNAPASCRKIKREGGGLRQPSLVPFKEMEALRPKT